MLRAVILDLDDTLYPERMYVGSGFRIVATEVASRYGLESDRVFEELWQIFAEGGTAGTFDLWAERRGFDCEVAAQMVRTYREHEPSLRLDSHVARVLRLLGSRYDLALVTDGDGHRQRRKVSALGLEPFFTSIIYTHDLGTGAAKPSEAPFRAALKHLERPAAEAVYVGDNPAKDFLGPRRLGMSTVRLRRPDGIYARSEPASEAYASDMEIADLDALADALCQLSQR